MSLRYYKNETVKHFGFPKGATMFIVFIALQDIAIETPPKEEDYCYLKLTSKGRFMLSLPKGNTGKKAFLRGFYFNNKGDEGIMSRDVSVIVSG